MIVVKPGDFAGADPLDPVEALVVGSDGPDFRKRSTLAASWLPRGLLRVRATKKVSSTCGVAVLRSILPVSSSVAIATELPSGMRHRAGTGWPASSDEIARLTALSAIAAAATTVPPAAAVRAR